MDSIMYNIDNECGDQCYTDPSYFDYEYVSDQETFSELYEYCIFPTFNDTSWYLGPVILTAIICNVTAGFKKLPHTVFHCIMALSGIFTIWYYAYECFYFLLVFIMLSYIFLHLPKHIRRGMNVFLPSLIIILYCEFFMKPKEWHKIRGIIMIAAMKAISIAIDKSEMENFLNFYEYIGYMLCSITLLFGPWTSFENYLNLYKNRTWKFRWIFIAIIYIAVAFLCLCVSNCWTSWILNDSAKKWIIAFRDALGFRMSHYFISFTASSIMLIGGYPLSQTLVTKPLEIEVPRSLVQVVISWNIPMHNWLKTYVFRPGCKQFGRFGAITMTYLASSLLHGLNFQLAAVLLSLGFYTYIEYQFRNMLANIFDACIASKQCSLHKCVHSKTLRNCYWTILVNALFSFLTLFHLTYLGLMFDMSDAQETGYSYKHTIEKWSELGFASHWVAFITYCVYYLIR